MSRSGDEGSYAPAPIGSSNIGFQLLKKHGWKEGTGLGASEQGRLEPLKTYLKKNKRGLGADKVKELPQTSRNLEKTAGDEKLDKLSSKKQKAKLKKMKKVEEFEKRLQEKEFERAFYREFWPENL